MEAWWPVSCAYSCALATCVLSGVGLARLLSIRCREVVTAIFSDVTVSTPGLRHRSVYSDEDVCHDRDRKLQGSLVPGTGTLKVSMVQA